MDKLKEALNIEVWIWHKIGDKYVMDGKEWSISYYPIFEDGKTNKPYSEPRALIERPEIFNGITGTDFREVPLRFLTRIYK